MEVGWDVNVSEDGAERLSSMGGFTNGSNESVCLEVGGRAVLEGFREGKEAYRRRWVDEECDWRPLNPPSELLVWSPAAKCLRLKS